MIQRDGFTYFCYVQSNSGDQFAAQIENSTRIVTRNRIASRYSFDDHGRPVPNFLSDGRLIVTYTGNHQDNFVRYRISSDASVANLGAEQALEMPGTTTYPVTLSLPDRLLLINKANSSDWYVTEYKPSLDSWTEPLELMSPPAQYYLMPRIISPDETIRVLGTRNPQAASHSLRIFDIDLTDGSGLAFSGSTLHGYLDGSAASGGATLPMSESEAAAIYTPTGTRKIRLYDMSATGTEIIIDDFEADGTDCKRLLGRLTGANPHDAADWTWTELMADAGDSFYTPSNYRGGAVFANEPHSGHRIYNTYRTGGTAKLERWDSADWSTWTVTEMLSSTVFNIVRPVSTVGAIDEWALFYLRLNSYSNYQVQDSSIYVAPSDMTA